MRDLLNKLLTGSMVVGAALVVSACGGSENANTAENTTTTTGMDTMEPVDGTTNDMTAVDGANGMGNMSADANMTMDTNMTGGNMTGGTTGGNMTGGTTGGNMTGGNMTGNTATGNTTNAM